MAMMKVDGLQVTYLDGAKVKSTSQVFYNTANRALYYKTVIDGLEQTTQFDHDFGIKPYKFQFKHIW